jgi:hypothetical protein
MRDIDIYDAETKRIAAVGKVMTDQGQAAEGIQALVEQMINDALETNLLPILQANMSGSDDQSGNPDAGTPGNVQLNAPAQPPIPGAQQADDGQWYMLDPTRRTRYLRIGPLMQERAPPGARTAGS